MTDADKIMNPQRFRNDPADIRIRINPEIWIPLLDHFWLTSIGLGGVRARSPSGLVVIVMLQ